MLGAAQGGEFDVLLVGYVSHGQQNLRRTLELLQDILHPAGVPVYFCDEEILSSADRHWDQLVDEAKAADSWLRKHRRQVREGLAAKLTTKRDPGGHPPFGFRRDPDKLVEPDPAKLPLVRRVFELSAAGLPDREVASLVGLPLFTVRSILTSPLYVGRLRDGAPADWEPIVPVELWESARSRRARRATTTGRPADPRRPYALDMFHCAGCGKHLIGDIGYDQLEAAIAGSDDATPEVRQALACRLREKPGYRRFLRVTRQGLLRIDRAAVAAEARLDGTLLLRSDPSLSAVEVAIGYQQLLEVERAWRDLKTSLALRPVYHRREARIRAHVLLCWLALLLVRMAEQATGETWRRLRSELDKLHLGRFSGPAGEVAQRTETTASQAAIFRALAVAEPPRFFALAPARAAATA